MEVNFVLDTNIVLYELGGRLLHPLPDGPYAVSAVSVIELLSYHAMSLAEEQRIQDFLAGVIIVDVTLSVREEAIRLRRSHRMPVPDAIVAGTAFALGVVLLTSDRRLSNKLGTKCRLVELSTI